jgi:hypothetical protein
MRWANKNEAAGLNDVERVIRKRDEALEARQTDVSPWTYFVRWMVRGEDSHLPSSSRRNPPLPDALPLRSER